MNVPKSKPLSPARLDNVFFTSDTHFGHGRIIELCNRPFSNVEQMNAEIVRSINDIVAEDATLFHLGDVALGGWKEQIFQVSRLNVKNKVLFPGNHDAIHPIDKRSMREDVKQAFAEQFDNKVGANTLWMRFPDMPTVGLLPIGEPVRFITMSHFPMRGLESDDRHHEWYMPNVGQVLHLCGHVHDRWGFNSVDGVLNVNVGWDIWKRPLSLAQILSLAESR